MRNWLFELEDLDNTPSRRDGINKETEQRYRQEGVKLILDVGQALKLDPHPTLATAAVYFHRFYMDHSFKEFGRHITALSCLFLAGKVEETPKKCKDILSAAREKFTDEQWARVAKYPLDELMAIERVLLQTIKFDLVVQHPYDFVLKYAKIFNRKREIHEVVQAAWTFVNDSLNTTLCLLWEPEVIAIALIFLASRFCKVQLTDWNGRRGGGKDEKWYYQFVENLDQQTLEDICHSVLDFYSNTNQTGGGAAAVVASKTSPQSTGSTPRSASHTPVPQPTTNPPPSAGNTPRGSSRPSTSSAGSHSTQASSSTRSAHHAQPSRARPSGSTAPPIPPLMQQPTYGSTTAAPPPPQPYHQPPPPHPTYGAGYGPPPVPGPAQPRFAPQQPHRW